MRRSLILLVALVAACSSGPSTTSSTAPPAGSTTTSEPVTTTSTMVSTTTSLPSLSPGDLVLPVATGSMPDTWRELFTIPYGETPETLGTSLGGDGEGVYWGPEYGAQAPDGSWWFLDTAKYRLAHFDADGEYIEEVAVPTEMLVNGVYFQWTFPKVMRNGTVLAARITGGTHYIRYRDGKLDGFEVPVAAVPRTDDGELVYAMDFEDSSLWAVDPRAATAERTDTMRARDGSRFLLTVGPSTIHLELPDAGTTVDMVFTAAGIGGNAHLSIEAVGDDEGNIHLFILGFPEADESQQLAGYARVTADGSVVILEEMMSPFSLSDPGTPTRLGVTPGTSTPTYMVVGDEGVTVYTRD